MKEMVFSRLVTYPVQVAYEAIANIGLYPEMFYYISDLQILYERENYIRSLVCLSHRAMKSSYECEIFFKPNKEIRVVVQKSGPFKFLETIWQFHESESGLLVSCKLRYNLRPFFPDFLARYFLESKSIEAGNIFESRMKDIRIR